MGDITAIILAAGMGVRMGPRGRLQPKGLIPVGGQTMIAQSVASLRAWGAVRIVIVTGHLADQYEVAFDGQDVTLVHNPHYATTGSLLSLSQGLATVSGACVILESDLIYAPQALEIIDGKRNVLVTSGPTGAGDEVYIWTRSAPGGPEHLVTMSKQIDALDGPHFGELVGITGLTADAVEALREVTLRELERDPAEHYEPGLVALTRDFPIEVERIDDLPWAEVDDEAMLARAERLVYPQVMAARAKSAIFEIPGATQGKVGLNPPYSA